VQIEGEGWLTFCDSICSQQTFQIHKKMKNRRNSLWNCFNCIIIHGSKHNLDFYYLFEKFQFYLKLGNTAWELARDSWPWSPNLHCFHTLFNKELPLVVCICIRTRLIKMRYCLKSFFVFASTIFISRTVIKNKRGSEVREGRKNFIRKIGTVLSD